MGFPQKNTPEQSKIRLCQSVWKTQNFRRTRIPKRCPSQLLPTFHSHPQRKDQKPLPGKAFRESALWKTLVFRTEDKTQKPETLHPRIRWQIFQLKECIEAVTLPAGNTAIAYSKCSWMASTYMGHVRFCCNFVAVKRRLLNANSQSRVSFSQQ